MPIADFESLCRAFADMAGLRPPVLVPANPRTLAATVRLRGVEVTFLQFTEVAPRVVFLLAELGAMPDAVAHEGWQALLDANLLMAGEQAPVFSRNPRTGAALMQWACPLDAVAPQEVFRRACVMVDLALRWREGHFIHGSWPGEWPRAEIDAGPAASSGLAAFGRLFNALRQGNGEPVAALPEGQVLAFPIEIDGKFASVTWDPGRSTACGLVLFGLEQDLPRVASVLDQTILLDANFALMSDARGLVFSRDTHGGAIQLQHVVPLDAAAADVTGFLEHLKSVLQTLSRLQALAEPA